MGWARYRCTRLKCPRLDVNCPIRIMTTPYRFIPWALWPMLKHCRPDNLARGHLSLSHRLFNRPLSQGKTNVFTGGTVHAGILVSEWWGSEFITDPGGWPSIPDQSPFPGWICSAARCGKSSYTDLPPVYPTIPATCKEIVVPLWTSTHTVARFATGETHYRIPVPAICDQTRPRSLRRRYQKQTVFLYPWVQGGSPGAGAVESRHSSMVSISVGTGGACDGAVGTRHLNSAPSSANPAEGPVMAATTWSAGPCAGSLTAYTGRAHSGVGCTNLQ